MAPNLRARLRAFDDLADDLMRPIAHVPDHPIKLARFGVGTLLPASVTARRWHTEKARALFGGVAAHGFVPLHHPLTSAIGRTIITAGHRHGWPVAEGGSRAITDALAMLLDELGGKIHTGTAVRAAGDVPPADIVLLDLAPRAIADIYGDRLPGRVERAYRRYRHGPGAFKVDLAIEGDVPWKNAGCSRAGTVHLGGSFEEIATTERMIASGRMPERPFTLVGQQYIADPTRSSGGVNPLWAYAHVPHGYTGDATEAIVAQIERFAPWLPRPHHRHCGTADDGVRHLQPQLRRRRHPHRCQHPPAAPRPPTCRDRPLLHRHSGDVRLLGGGASRCGCARDVRLPRGGFRVRHLRL